MNRGEPGDLVSLRDFPFFLGGTFPLELTLVALGVRFASGLVVREGRSVLGVHVPESKMRDEPSGRGESLRADGSGDNGERWEGSQGVGEKGGWLVSAGDFGAQLVCTRNEAGEGNVVEEGLVTEGRGCVLLTGVGGVWLIC